MVNDMKIEDEVYVLTKEEDGEILYLIDSYDGYDFDADIRHALRCVNKITASYVKDDFINETKMVVDLQAIPIKITYEW